MGSSGIVSDTNRFYILIIKKLCQHLQNGLLLVKFQMGFLWKTEERDNTGPAPHGNKVCALGACSAIHSHLSSPYWVPEARPFLFL